MGLLNKLLQDGSEYSAFDGGDIPTMQGASDQSALHNEYSITGVANPNFFTANINTPQPSLLDLNGQTPTVAGHGNTTPGASTQTLPYTGNEPG